MFQDSSDTYFWLALLRAPGIGPARFAKLLEHFGSAEAVFGAQHQDWASLGLPEATLDYLRAPDWALVERDLSWLEGPNNHMIRWHESRYPPLLRQIPQPPPLLFVHGDCDCLRAQQIAIVGTRNPTPAGKAAARDFAAHLAQVGLVITSGLALGVDAEAHRGALQSQGCTVAVMGTGLDRIYPARHRDLAHAIAQTGAVVSELPLGTSALAEHFPRRNRIISGLSLGVLVVEAAQKSGSLITARLAADQGREVFAIPGSIHNAMARGCHRLIRQGAKLVETAADILEELGPLAETVFEAEVNGKQVSSTNLSELDEESRQLLAHLEQEPMSIDLLVDRCGLTPEVISSMLLVLEIQGYVTAIPGGLYSRLKI